MQHLNMLHFNQFSQLNVVTMRSHVRVNYKKKQPYFFLLSRAYTLPCGREREFRARSRSRANAVRKTSEQQQRRRRRSDKTGTVYLHITRSEFGAEISRPVGLCYRCRRLRIFTGRNNRVSVDGFKLWSRSVSKERGVRWRKWRCGCNLCTSFLCLKMADRPLGPEQQVPCQ